MCYYMRPMGFGCGNNRFFGFPPVSFWGMPPMFGCCNKSAFNIAAGTALGFGLAGIAGSIINRLC